MKLPHFSLNDSFTLAVGLGSAIAGTWYAMNIDGLTNRTDIFTLALSTSIGATGATASVPKFVDFCSKAINGDYKQELVELLKVFMISTGPFAGGLAGYNIGNALLISPQTFESQEVGTNSVRDIDNVLPAADWQP